MELEFDKEIDALLRTGSRTPETATVASLHLDADGLSGFAEGALPASSRQAYTLHLADCDRCRKILSGLIVLNSEVAPERSAAVAAPVVVAEETVPWYRRLFLAPNLAYVMGGLILVFGGFLSFQLLQTGPMNTATGEMPHLVEADRAAGGPSAEAPPELAVASNTTSTNTDVSGSSVANTNAATFTANTAASNTMPTMANTAPRPAATPAPAVVAEAEVRTQQLDAVTGAPAPAAAAPPPPKEENQDADKEKKKAVAKESDKNAAETADMSSMSARRVEQLPRAARSDLKMKPGPSRDMQSQFPNSMNTAGNAAATRRVGGRTFEYRDGVWYDKNYAGGATISVRRGSEEYRKLDKGLRKAADEIGGTVVIVWGSKNYRIG